MDYNQYNSNYNQNVPPYPQANYDFRDNKLNEKLYDVIRK